MFQKGRTPEMLELLNFASELECPVCEGIIGEPVEEGGCIGSHDLAAFDFGYGFVGVNGEYDIECRPPPQTDSPDVMIGYAQALEDYGYISAATA